MLRTFRVCVPLALALCLTGCAEPPNKEMNQAQGAIDAARAAGADQYAGTELARANDALARSHEAVAQNDYRLALSLALDSNEYAQVAAKTAVENRAAARGDAERGVAEANSALSLARSRLDDAALAKIPRRVADELRSRLTSAEKLLQEAREAVARDEYTRATETADAVSLHLRETLALLEKAEAAPPARKRR